MPDTRPKKTAKKGGLDMGFHEALTRFAKTDPKEVQESILEKTVKTLDGVEDRSIKRRKNIEDGVRKPGKKIPL